MRDLFIFQGQARVYMFVHDHQYIFVMIVHTLVGIPISIEHDIAFHPYHRLKVQG